MKLLPCPILIIGGLLLYYGFIKQPQAPPPPPVKSSESQGEGRPLSWTRAINDSAQYEGRIMFIEGWFKYVETTDLEQPYLIYQDKESEAYYRHLTSIEVVPDALRKFCEENHLQLAEILGKMHGRFTKVYGKFNSNPAGTEEHTIGMLTYIKSIFIYGDNSEDFKGTYPSDK